MKATEANLLKLLRKSPQFVIPIYLRNYSWTAAQCRQLPAGFMLQLTQEALECQIGMPSPPVALSKIEHLGEILSQVAIASVHGDCGRIFLFFGFLRPGGDCRGADHLMLEYQKSAFSPTAPSASVGRARTKCRIQNPHSIAGHFQVLGASPSPKRQAVGAADDFLVLQHEEAAPTVCRAARKGYRAGALAGMSFYFAAPRFAGSAQE